MLGMHTKNIYTLLYIIYVLKKYFKGKSCGAIYMFIVKLLLLQWKELFLYIIEPGVSKIVNLEKFIVKIKLQIFVLTNVSVLLIFLQ